MKDKIRRIAHHLFTTYGPYQVSLDELSHTLAISKKTIYKYYESKEQLVETIVQIGLIETKREIGMIQRLPADPVGRDPVRRDPVTKILMIYHLIFQKLHQLNPDFLHETQKYYPHIFALIENFRVMLIDRLMTALLTEAKQQGIVREAINEKLLVSIHWAKISQLLYEHNLFRQPNGDLALLFEHLIVVTLRGVVNAKYIQTFDRNSDYTLVDYEVNQLLKKLAKH